MCSAAKINWPIKLRSVFGISEMAIAHDIVNDMLLEDKLVQMLPDYPCILRKHSLEYLSIPRVFLTLLL